VRSNGVLDVPSPCSTTTSIAADALAGSVTGAAEAPGARAIIALRGSSAQLVLTSLAGPPDGQVYQAWLLSPPRNPVPTGGLLAVPRAGEVRVDLPRLTGVQRVIVTAEPEGGSLKPTLPAVAVVSVPG